MQAILKQAKPNCMEDLIALNALYRPGPMDNIPQFIASKTGKTPITYPDPCLEPILKETYGVIVYQEQVMQVAQRIGGYSLGQADLLRRAMGKKKHDVMIKEKEKFIAGRRQERLQGGRRRSNLRDPDSLRGLRLQQVACRGLQRRRLSHRLPQGQLSGRVHGRQPHQRDLEHRQAHRVHRRGAVHGARGAPARREPLGAAFLRRRR